MVDLKKHLIATSSMIEKSPLAKLVEESSATASMIERSSLSKLVEENSSIAKTFLGVDSFFQDFLINEKDEGNEEDLLKIKEELDKDSFLEEFEQKYIPKFKTNTSSTLTSEFISDTRGRQEAREFSWRERKARGPFSY